MRMLKNKELLTFIRDIMLDADVLFPYLIYFILFHIPLRLGVVDIP